MNKRLLTIIIISTLLCSGCLESFSSEYKRGYNDGYNNPDEETLQCVIAYYNKCIDYYNVNNAPTMSHLQLVQHGEYVWFKHTTCYDYSVTYPSGHVHYLSGSYCTPLESPLESYIRLTDQDYELYCYGYLEGLCTRNEEAYNTHAKINADEKLSSIESELNNMSECR